MLLTNNMKLTKETLQQIIKEELENLVNEEDAIDYAKRQEGYEDKIFSMLNRKDALDPETARKSLKKNTVVCILMTPEISLIAF